MDTLQQLNLFLDALTKIPQADEVQIAIRTTQSAIRRYLGQPYESYTVEDAKTTMDVAGKVLKQFATSQKDIDLIDFTVNLSKMLMDTWEK